MSNTNGGPAFPVAQSDHVTSPGMTLRDYFAGQALAGIMSDEGMRPSNESEFAHLTKRLYQVADAMLAAREG